LPMTEKIQSRPNKKNWRRHSCHLSEIVYSWLFIDLCGILWSDRTPHNLSRNDRTLPSIVTQPWFQSRFWAPGNLLIFAMGMPKWEL
jgi:hypothetical protein